MILQRQHEDRRHVGSYNVGPDDSGCISTGNLANLFCKAWGSCQSWENRHAGGPHEDNYLKLDCSKMKAAFGWKPMWDVEEAVAKTVEWTRAYMEKRDVCKVMVTIDISHSKVYYNHTRLREATNAKQ